MIFYWLLWKKVQLARFEEIPPQERISDEFGRPICTTCHVPNEMDIVENDKRHTIELMFLVLGYLKGLELAFV